MVTVTALFRAALWWQIKADGVEKIGWGQLRGTHRNVDLYLWTTQTYLSEAEIDFSNVSDTDG